MDAHTHKLRDRSQVYILSPEDIRDQSVRAPHYAVGVHPWYVDKVDTQTVKKLAASKACVAIGETGLDRLHPHWEKQVELFHWHWDLAEELNKPLVLHIVRSSSDLLQLMKRRKPKTPWLWHDFTGPVEALPKLLKLHPEMYFSCGQRAIRRPDFQTLWSAISSERRLLETDDNEVEIEQIFGNANVSWGEIKPNYYRLFPSIDW